MKNELVSRPSTIAFMHIYDRWSNPDQKKNGGTTLMRQRHGAHGWFRVNQKRLNLAIGNEYQDDGKSAWKRVKGKDGKLKLGDLGRLLNDIDTGVIKSGDIVICDTMCRLSREPARIAMQRLLNRFWDNGVSIVTVADPYFYDAFADEAAKTDAMQHAFEQMKIANGESVKKSNMVRSAKEIHRLAAIHAKVPYPGCHSAFFKRVPTGQKITFIVPADDDNSFDETHEAPGASWQEIEWASASAVRGFEIALTGLGAPSIADKLIAEGVRCPVKGGWTEAYVSTMLRDEALRGHTTFYQCNPSTGFKYAEPVRVENYYPRAIVNDALWYPVQRLLDRRFAAMEICKVRPGEKVANLYGAKFLCICGQRASLEHHETLGRVDKRSFRCSGNYRRPPRPCSNKVSIFPTPLENAILDTIGPVIFQTHRFAATRVVPIEAAAVGVIEAEIEALTTQIAATTSLAIKSANDAERDHYQAENRKLMAAKRSKEITLDKARHALNNQRAAATTTGDVISGEIIAACRRGDMGARQQVSAALQQVIDTMVMNPDRTVNIVLAGGAFEIIINHHGSIDDIIYVDADGAVIALGDDDVQGWFKLRFGQSADQLALFDRLNSMIRHSFDHPASEAIRRLGCKLRVRQTVAQIAAIAAAMTPLPDNRTDHTKALDAARIARKGVKRKAIRAAKAAAKAAAATAELRGA
jgi:hypothetical protein